VLIDGAVLLLAYMSSAGSTEQTLIGCRQVSYFTPLEIAVLNTTVIFEDYEHQKNLDPLQKLTGDYINMQGEGVPPPPVDELCGSVAIVIGRDEVHDGWFTIYQLFFANIQWSGHPLARAHCNTSR
jgi:hypothetical protein